jgi:hypothetical protein
MHGTTWSSIRILVVLVPLVLALRGPANAQFAGDASPSRVDNAFDLATQTPAQLRIFSPKHPRNRYRAERVLLPEEEAEDEAERAETKEQRKAAKEKAEAERKARKGVFQTRSLDSWPRLYQSESLSVTGLFNAGIAPFAMTNNAFDAPPGSINAGLPPNPGWSEYYVQPGFAAKYHVDKDAYVYGGFSFVESGTVGNDYSGAPSRWYGLPEEAYLGLHLAHLLGSTATLDASYGQRDYTNGNGMLVWSGATNTQVRGAAYLAPRNAWRDCGLLKATLGDYSAQVFYLRPNESAPEFTNSSLTGMNVVWNPPGQLRLGAQYVYSRSNIVTQANLSTWELRARLHPLRNDPYLWLQGDYAIQGKPGVAADGWMVQGNYNFTRWWLQPLVHVGYYNMSASNPDSVLVWNGFNPLYFGNAVPSWQPGIALQTLLHNTNQGVFDTTVELSPKGKGTLQLNYFATRVGRANAIVGTLAPGVQPPASGGLVLPGYGNETSASYTYDMNKSLAINPIFAYVTPGSGIKQDYAAHGGAAKPWSFLGVSLTASY